MNVTNRNLLLLIILLISQIGYSKNSNSMKDTCENKNVTIKTDIKLRYKYFFFRRTNQKRAKRIDKVINQNGKVVMKITMKSTENGDYSWFRKFHRVVLVGEEIHKVVILFNEEKGKLTVYNYCGKKISEQYLKATELYDKYRF